MWSVSKLGEGAPRGTTPKYIDKYSVIYHTGYDDAELTKFTCNTNNYITSGYKFWSMGKESVSEIILEIL